MKLFAGIEKLFRERNEARAEVDRVGGRLLKELDGARVENTQLREALQKIAGDFPDSALARFAQRALEPKP